MSIQLKTANPAAKNPFADQPNPFQVMHKSEILYLNQTLNSLNSCQNKDATTDPFASLSLEWVNFWEQPNLEVTKETPPHQTTVNLKQSIFEIAS